jgi:two-component system, chemotaxis family, CheB/CheR fusion protein
MSAEPDLPIPQRSAENPTSSDAVTEREANPDNEDDAQRSICPVVGIGASAGGLDAFTQMLEQLPANTGMAFVLVQHLDPTHESILTALLSSHTAMPVQQAEQGTKVAPNHIYVIPPNTRMAIKDGVLVLTPRANDRMHNLPIDFFLSSLAEDQKSHSIGVILSGAASDGTIGLEAVKAAGGITFAQDGSAKFDSMPRSAIAAGVVDFVLTPGAIARELGVIANHFHLSPSEGNAAVEDGPSLNQILSLLQSRSGVNFTQYKQATISRRLSRRMALNHVETLGNYLDLLRRRPAEVDALFDDVLITVTEFFRDPDTFEALTEKAFPTLLRRRKPDEAIRVWVSGCASGKEVYSLAICLIEFLERAGQSFPIQIFGTDLSERSIEAARHGRYPDTIAASVSPERLRRFFVKVEGGYQIASSIRDVCVFSRQDVTKDPPLSRMDLISCRNLLIYLGRVLQERVVAIFNYALQAEGCLLLGRSETLGSLNEYFIALDSKHRIYQKNPRLERPTFELPLRVNRGPNFTLPRPASPLDDATLLDLQTDRILVAEYVPGGFLVNAQHQVVKFRGEIGPYLAPRVDDSELNVFKLVRNEIVNRLRSTLADAERSGSPVRDHVRMSENSKMREIDLVVRPLTAPTNDRYFLVLFEEGAGPWHEMPSSETAALSESEAKAKQQNLAAELYATRSYMQRLVEELRSANEEAQSANEELQSTNEELQTAKEELQSSNEELTTTNEEMQSRNGELGVVNTDLVNLLSSMQTPIVMLDSQLRIRRYTPVAEKIMNLIPTDIGRPISNLKPRIHVPELNNWLRSVIHSAKAVEREVQDEDGRWYSLRIQPYRTPENQVNGVVLQMLDIHQLKVSIGEAQAAREYAEGVIEAVRQPLLVLDHVLCVQSANRAFYETFGTAPEQTLGRKIGEIASAQLNLPQTAEFFTGLRNKKSAAVHEVEIEREFAGLGWRSFHLSAHRVHRSRPDGLILLAIEDVTDRKRTAEEKYRRLFEAAQDGIIIIDAESGAITDVNPFILDLLGLNRSDLIGRHFWETPPLANGEGVRSALIRLREKEVVRLPDLTIKAKDGRQIEMEVVGNVYHEGAKRVAQFNLRDITERKDFNQQLQQTAKLESLGVLAGGIAHDFNNLLAGILGNAGLALSDAPQGSPYHSALKDVVHASQRAADLTRQMLAYAGKGRFVVRPVNFSELVRDITDLLRSSIPKSIELELEAAQDLPSVEADASQMQQILMNLVINGAEAIGDGNNGRVHIRTRSQELSPEFIRANFSSGELTPGTYVILEVTDTGAGMDEKTRTRIFDPFYTTKFTGRGLGLASVQGILRTHHGAVRVESSPGQGATFRVFLPAIAKPGSRSEPEADEGELNGSGLVLVIDDEEIVLRTTEAILERAGYHVLTAANGEEGLERVREKREKLRLVVLDLTMPVMGGEEALARIKEIAPELPVVLSSGYDGSQAMSLFGDDTVAGFIQKPASVTNYLRAVKEALR